MYSRGTRFTGEANVHITAGFLRTNVHRFGWAVEHVRIRPAGCLGEPQKYTQDASRPKETKLYAGVLCHVTNSQRVYCAARHT